MQGTGDAKCGGWWQRGGGGEGGRTEGDKRDRGPGEVGGEEADVHATRDTRRRSAVRTQKNHFASKASAIGDPKIARKGIHALGQFNIFRALRREPRGQKPPNKVRQASEWGRPDPQNKPRKDHQGFGRPPD
jgi:hypothetical protein